MMSKFVDTQERMIFMKRLISILLLLCLMLTACVAPQTETPATTEPSITDPSTEPSSEPTDPTTEPTTEPPVLYRNPLTGEPMDAPSENRPYAVMISNIKGARPQHGTSQAAFLYEILAEGGITRCMAIFTDVSVVPALGSIRSARKYYVDIASSYDALYVHGGGSDEAYAYMKEIGFENMDGVNGAYSGSYFYRDQNRLDQGYQRVHTLFISGQSVVDFATRLKYTLTRPGGVSYGYTFDEENAFEGQTANKIVVKFHTSAKPSSGTKSTTLTYDPETNSYYAYQHAQNYIDGNTQEAVPFRNVLILKAETNVQPENGSLLTINTYGTGTGYYACNGQMIPINWSRDGLNDPFVYTLEDGTPLTFGIGSTYVAVIPTHNTIDVQ